MTQLSPVKKSKLADSAGVPQIGDRGAAITAAAATTYAAPSVTAANPAAPAAYSAVTNMTEPVAKAEGETLSAALEALRDEVALYELQISAIIVDNAATLVELDDLNDTVVLLIVALNAAVERLEAHGLIANN